MESSFYRFMFLFFRRVPVASRIATGIQSSPIKLVSKHDTWEMAARRVEALEERFDSEIKQIQTSMEERIGTARQN